MTPVPLLLWTRAYQWAVKNVEVLQETSADGTAMYYMNSSTAVQPINEKCLQSQAPEVKEL